MLVAYRFTVASFFPERKSIVIDFAYTRDNGFFVSGSVDLFLVLR